MTESLHPVPRFMVCAPNSGAGKTTIACALLHALKRRGLKLLACKCGPDYIDPAFHSRAIGAKSRNVDLFFTGEQTACDLIAKNFHGCDLAVMEGAMGFYDGIAVGSDDSAWDIARATKTPAILIVDGRGRAISIAAEIHGFASFRKNSMISGVILNRISPMLCQRLKPAIEEATGIPVLGCVPNLPDCGFESRHLGLVGADEMTDLMEKLDRLADAIDQHVSIDGLLEIANGALPLSVSKPNPNQPINGKPTLAVAKDEAFNFYYEDAFDCLREAGLNVVHFSPLHDSQIPECASGLYLGGGYPELHAAKLAANESMLKSIKAAIDDGMPTIAECGGFLYLHKSLEDQDGNSHALVGVINAHAFKTDKLGRFGYVTLHAKDDSLIAQKGETLQAHEFHYWDSEACGDSFIAKKPQSARSWECVHATSTLYAGFPHLALQGNQTATQRFAQACAEYALKSTSAASQQPEKSPATSEGSLA